DRAKVDRFPMQLIEAGKMSARHYHFPEKGSAFSDPSKRESREIHTRIGQSAVATENMPAQVLKPLGWIFCRHHKEGAMVWALTSSKGEGGCRQNRGLIVENFQQRITADLGK